MHTTNCLKLAESVNPDITHALVVRKLALQLFDELRPLHELGRIERQWLGLAALFHDVGKTENSRKHHKLSRDFILAQTARIIPDKAKRIIVALVARYHKGALPYKRHRYYRDLSASARAVVDKLAALLRLADALDKGHTGAAKKLKCRLRESLVKITVKCRHKLRQSAIRRKSGLLSKVFGATLRVRRIAA